MWRSCMHMLDALVARMSARHTLCIRAIAHTLTVLPDTTLLRCACLRTLPFILSPAHGIAARQVPVEVEKIVEKIVEVEKPVEVKVEVEKVVYRNVEREMMGDDYDYSSAGGAGAGGNGAAQKEARSPKSVSFRDSPPVQQVRWHASRLP